MIIYYFHESQFFRRFRSGDILAFSIRIYWIVLENRIEYAEQTPADCSDSASLQIYKKNFN